MIVGQTRYSILAPDSKAWRVSRGDAFSSYQQYKDYLFSEKRLEDRNTIFIEQTLPTLADTARKLELKHIISYSTQLPGKYRVFLEESATKYDFIILDPLEVGETPMSPDSIAAEVLNGNGVYGKYRLDDDDIVSKTFFDRMSEYIHPHNVGMVVSFPRGVVAVWDGGITNVREAYWPKIAIGLTSVCEVRKGISFKGPKYNSHTSVDTHAPLILDGRYVSYIRLMTLEQDTTVGTDAGADLTALKDSLKRYPELDKEISLDILFPHSKMYLENGNT
ncbi:glycosyltransferase [Corynebacterium cystitidis]|uniref:Putative rhamnosyl transferase n=1 Tax=Corynebacterium cystitidis DSM 20524 TaxID=1121357 RepID=A0A1H9WQI5_9CORY|nr:glycosyltransferase [Corynebacterium cystitidis]WJY82935.1 hypothetical protein CCYS_10115 [Corynebacterium cystitidis DSM 20524]SES36206.1 Putative rhamnosyl transferase [Corynebacterium cystitidis DSM 20524]SNV68856.1 Protein of uncharacterised function (DUF3118) [Corynebacterium cystitidis]